MLKRREYPAAVALAQRSFDALDRPDYSEFGRASFFSYASLVCFAARQLGDHVTFAARDENGGLFGILELRGRRHISMLFVEPTVARHGVATALFNHALAFIRYSNPRLARMTVNSSPYARPFYERMGFTESHPLVDESGFVYIPMSLELSERPRQTT